MQTSMKWLFRATVLSLACVFIPHGVSAATATWDGGGADNLMSTAANWTGNVLPSAGDTLNFDNTNTKDATWDSSFVAAQNFALNISATYTGTVTIASSTLSVTSINVLGGTLNFGTTNVTVDGDFQSGASATAVTSTYGGGTLTVNNLTLGAGATTLPYTTTVKGNVSLTGATITNDSAHNYTLTMSSTTAQTFTILPSGRTFRNITINNSAGVTFSGATNPYTIAGTLTINGGSTMTVATGKTVILTGSFSNSGTLVQSGTGVLRKASASVNVSNASGTAAQTGTYINGSRIYFSVTDEDENEDGTTPDTLTVTVTNSLNDRETVTLTETGNATELFVGSLPVHNVDAAILGDGNLDLSGNIVITVSYGDAQDSTDTGTYNATYNGPGVKKAIVYPLNPNVTINNGDTQTHSPTVTLQLIVSGATQMVIAFEPTFAGTTWEAYTATKTITLPDGLGPKTVYVKYVNDPGNVTDTVSATIELVAANTSVTPVPTQPQQQTPAEPQVPSNQPITTVNVLAQGDIVKSASNPAVYYFGQDGKRHAFPSESVFKTWFADYNSVRVVSDDLLASLPLGKNMSIRPGTRFIKLQTDPRVYAVGTNGTLHWITSEMIAKQLYGKDWAKRVTDVSDALFVNYTRGTDIIEAKYPDGTTIERNGGYYFVENGMLRKFVTPDVYAQHMIPVSFVPKAPATFSMKDGAPITSVERSIMYPTTFSAPIE